MYWTGFVFGEGGGVLPCLALACALLACSDLDLLCLGLFRWVGAAAKGRTAGRKLG